MIIVEPLGLVQACSTKRDNAFFVFAIDEQGETEMSALMDHYDFKSARRALVFGSVSLFVASELTLISSEIEIFKLKLAVSQEKIVILASIVVLYLMYIFTIRLFDVLPLHSEQVPNEIETNFLSFFDEKRGAHFELERMYEEMEKRLREGELWRSERAKEVQMLSSPARDENVEEAWKDLALVQSEVRNLSNDIRAMAKRPIEDLHRQIDRTVRRRYRFFLLSDVGPAYIAGLVALALAWV